MGKKHTFEYVKNYFEEQGCDLLEEDYKNCDMPINYRCKCGKISKISFANFKKGQRCASCGGTKKHTLEYVKNYFNEQGCELLEEEYRNARVKIKYKCKCGDESKISFDSFKRGSRCKKCGTKKTSIKSKYKFKYVKQYFVNRGCELLSKEYKNSWTKLKYKCSCKNVSETTFNRFQSGHRCIKCSGKEKYTFNYVKYFFTKEGCKLLSCLYTNARLPLDYICNCGNVSKITFDRFKRGHRCKKCSGTEKYTFEYVKQYFTDHNCDLLEKDYKNNQTLMKYICKCGNKSKIRFNDFKSGKRCIKCGGTEKHTFSYVQKYFKKQGCELLSNKYINNQTKMKYICKCGNNSEVTFNVFKKSHRCRKCGFKRITGKNHYLYNPNITDEERKIKRSYQGYVWWRNEVYKKDDYTCRKCNQRGTKLNAHHIKNYSSHKKLRLVISNGITFCRNCHKDFHNIYGIKNNNEQQLYEFLKAKNLKVG